MSKDNGISRVRSYFLTRGVPSYLLEPLRREESSGGTTGKDDDTDNLAGITREAGYLTPQQADAIISAVKEVERQSDRRNLRDIIINLPLAIISMIFLFHFVYYYSKYSSECDCLLYFITGAIAYPGWLILYYSIEFLRRKLDRYFVHK